MKREILFSWFKGQPELPFEEDKCSVNGISNVGWNELIQLLALHTGINAQPIPENKRILAYKRGLEKSAEHSFFETLFQQDPVVTAGFLLKQRDELRWYVRDFQELEKFGDRLSDFALVEANNTSNDVRGLPDIYWEVCDALISRPSLAFSMRLNEEPEFYPCYTKRFLKLLIDCGVEIASPPEICPSGNEGSNLYVFQKQIINLVNDQAAGHIPFREDDSSLVLFTTRYLTDASHELAAFLDMQEKEHWYVLRNPSDIQLGEVLHSSKGTLSSIKSEIASLPLTQVLRSFCNLIWKPLDIEAVYEFLNLPVKPFPQRLARKLTEALIEAPGVNSSKWKETLDLYWENFSRENDQQEGQFQKEQSQYRWWFEQTHYDPVSGADLSVFINQLSWIRMWALRRAQIMTDECSQNLYTELGNQCIEICDLAQMIVKQDKITRTDLDKLLDLVLKNKKKRTQNYSRYSSGVQQEIVVSRKTDRLIWWNFSGVWEESTVCDFLWSGEIKQLSQIGEIYFGRKENARLMRFAMARKILSIKSQLILSYSDFHGTKYHFPHSLWLYLKSLPREFCVEHLLTDQICTTTYHQVIPAQLKKASGVIDVKGLRILLPRERESYSSISNLLYYPHIYLFEDILGLRNRLNSSLKLDVILKGKIIHKFVEIALKNINLLKYKIDKDRWKNWCDTQIQTFIEQEAAILYKSRYAAEREALISKLNTTLFYLFDGISNEGWQVETVEERFEKPLDGYTLLIGRTDLVLKKNEVRFVVDLKSGSSTYKESEIAQNADWQLLLYSYFGHVGQTPTASAFFTTQKGEFIGRANPGIAHFKVVKPKAGEEITYENMLANLLVSMKLRIEQIQNGEIEFRNSLEAIEILPEVMGEIKMKTEINRFDSFLFLNTL